MNLYIDTTKKETEVAVFSQGQNIFTKKWQSEKNLSDELLHVINEAMPDRSKIRGIFINNTPGSYTGVRIGYATVNALGLALNIQPQAIALPVEIESSSEREVFKRPLLPHYVNEPFITKSKNRL